MSSDVDHCLAKHFNSHVPAPRAALSIINLDAYDAARDRGHHHLSTTPVHFRPYLYLSLIYLGLRLSSGSCPLQLHLPNLIFGHGDNTMTIQQFTLHIEPRSRA